MLKRERELRKAVADLGLRITEWSSRGGFYYATLVSPTGRTTQHTFSQGTSDIRGDLNSLATLRRFMKGEPPKVVVKKSRLSLPTTPEEAFVASVLPSEASDPPNPPQESPMPNLTPDVPAADPSKRKGAGQIMRNVLPHKEFYRLCQALQKVDLKDIKHATELVEPMQQELGLPLTAVNIRSALEAIGRELPKRSGPTKVTAGEAILAQALLSLYNHLGIDAPAELVSMGAKQ